MGRNPSFRDVQRARSVLEHIIPTKLVNVILHYAEYYACKTVTADRSQLQDDDTVILELALSPEESQAILHVSLNIDDYNHSGSSWVGLDDKTSARPSRTWYSIASDNSPVGGKRIATHQQSGPKTHTHDFLWDRDSELVREIKTSNIIRIWAHARCVNPLKIYSCDMLNS